MNETLDKLERDFFSVELIGAGQEKFVHIHGYAYHSDDVDEDGKEYRGVELAFCYIPISHFPITDKEYETAVYECKQGIVDLTEQECIDYMEQYYGSTKPMVLDYNDITPDTPCGCYITS